MSPVVLETNNVDFDDIKMYSCSRIIFVKVSSINNFMFYNNYDSELFWAKNDFHFFYKNKNSLLNNKDLQYNLCNDAYVYQCLLFAHLSNTVYHNTNFTAITFKFKIIIC